MHDQNPSFFNVDDLRDAWKATGWPEDLLETALELRIPRRQVEWWLAQGERGLQRARDWIPQLQQLTPATIVGREATLLDNDRFSDLWANAPEEIGDWEITVRPISAAASN